MSSDLYWRPYLKAAHPLPDELKFALRNRDLFNNSLNGQLTERDLDYLMGLRDGGISSAQKLIDAINKHGDIELVEEY